jgi:hypothetical protein
MFAPQTHPAINIRQRNTLRGQAPDTTNRMPYSRTKNMIDARKNCGCEKKKAETEVSA